MRQSCLCGSKGTEELVYNGFHKESGLLHAGLRKPFIFIYIYILGSLGGRGGSRFSKVFQEEPVSQRVPKGVVGTVSLLPKGAEGTVSLLPKGVVGTVFLLPKEVEDRFTTAQGG